MWNEQFRPHLHIPWDSDAMEWRQLIQQLLSRLSTDSLSIRYEGVDPFARISQEWAETWEFNPANAGNLYSIESSLDSSGLAGRMVKLSQPQCFWCWVMHWALHELS